MAYLKKCMWRAAFTSHTRGYITYPNPLAYSEEVLQAKAKNKPIVALESTILTHGMPYPQNLETGLQVENIIRQRGAIPATIAILKGQLTVGLTRNQLQYLAQAKNVVKVSRRDLAPVVAAKLDGGTTVAGTIIAADLADIPVFVTGGIGGVHRGGEDTMDVSADLNELGRSRTLVVCSGVKSILDIGKTLEYLETQGVCVSVFGDSDEFPAFYTTRSGHRAPYHVPNAERAARLLHAANTLRLGSGIVVAVPVPKEHAMDETTIENAISSALKEADAKHIQGKEVTPFILAEVANATKGASLAANIALIKNNAKVGADIAVEFNKLRNVHNLENASNIGFSKRAEISTLNPSRRFHTSFNMRDETATSDFENDLPIFQELDDLKNPVLVIGGANVDRNYRVTEDKIQLDGSTHACEAEHCAGGVGRNMAEALWRLRQGRVRLLTAIGDDADGHYLNNIAPGLILDGCIVKGERTPTYAAVLDAQGECRLGLGDMALHDHISIDLVNKNVNVLEKAPLIVLDGNIPQPTMDHVLELCHRLRKPVFFEPTDRRKAVKIFYRHIKPHIAYASPNLTELRAMANIIDPNVHVDKTGLIDEILGLSKIVVQFIDVLIVTIGANGVIIIKRNHFYRKKMSIEARLYPVNVINAIKSVSGAGDCFASGFIHGTLLGKNEALCVSMGMEAAKCALFTKATVPYNLEVNKIRHEAFFEILM